MLPRLAYILAWAALAAGLSLPTVAPEIANVSTLVLMGIGLVLLALPGTSRGVMRQPAISLTLAAGAVLLLALLVTAKSPLHVAAILVLAPLWLAGPHAGLLGWLGPRLTPLNIAGFALVGTAGALAIAAYDVLVRQTGRGGALVNNPIHLADLALILGFVALAGLLDRRPVRWLFLLGPVLALGTIWYSGSRGPFTAFVPTLGVAAAALALMILPRRTALAWLAASLVAVAVAGGYFMTSEMAGRFGTIWNEIVAALTGAPTDSSTGERLNMYRSAWAAFQASPIFGHGMIDYTQIAASYGPPDNPYPPSGHLHSDIADFGVIGGSAGLLSLALLLVAPLAGASAVRGEQRLLALFLGLMASVGYFTMGLTNAMFGVLTQTMVYGVLLALIAALGQQGRGKSA